MLGSLVTGSMQFNGGENWFDPANRFVPAGFLNAAGTMVTVAEPAIEFGAADSRVSFSANFTNNQLIVNSLVGSGGNAPWRMTFVDTALIGLTVSTLSDTHLGGLLVRHSGDTLTLDAPFLRCLPYNVALVKLVW